jgi:purine nucleoside phosphorylase
MSAPTTSLGLDETVFPLRERLQLAGVPEPRVLFLMATGAGFLPARLGDRTEVELGELCGECEPWSGQVLRAGRFGRLPVWFIDDVSGEPLDDEPSSPWMRAMPVWLAAAAGARVCVHASAGSALPVRESLVADGAGDRAPLAPPCLAVVRDHVNLSGFTPLLGLGESKLGPLFPDLVHLHHAGLRAAALRTTEAHGIPAAAAIAACTLGPALETPAERIMLARLGADVAVPNLAAPLLAAGHAGLAVLALVAVTDGGAGPTDVKRVVEAAGALQPALEDLVLALVPELETTADALAAEADA